MTYFDFNVTTVVAEKARVFGWQPFSPQRVFLKHASELRKLAEFSSVASESSQLLRQASKRAKLIDVSRLRGFERDTGLIRAVAENNAFFEIPLKVFLHAYGTYRAQRMQKYRDFLRACLKLGARFVFTSQAESEFDLKSPFEVLALLQQLGLNRMQAQAMLEKNVME